jgi:hypothetical protein
MCAKVARICSTASVETKNFTFPEYNFTIPTEKVISHCMQISSFKIFMFQLTFDSATFECLKRKMSLVSLKTEEENMCLQQQLAELGSSSL